MTSIHKSSCRASRLHTGRASKVAASRKVRQIREAIETRKMESADFVHALEGLAGMINSGLGDASVNKHKYI